MDHLLAGLALWEYSKQSSYLIFLGKTGDTVTDDILQALQDVADDGMSRTELMHHFNRNIKAIRIRSSLLQLKEDGWARVEAWAKRRAMVRVRSRVIVRNYSSVVVKGKGRDGQHPGQGARVPRQA